MKVIVTGGAGYIGSTICSALKDHGHVPIVWDSLVTGERSFTKEHIFYEADIACHHTLAKIRKEHPDADTVIHCAARIIVPESVAQPELYYTENVCKSLTLFSRLRDAGIHKVVFSSSASVYADSETFQVDESHPRDPKNPYAKTKAMMEDILFDFAKAYGFQSILLRYFNPIGADPQFRSGPFIANPSHLLGRLVAASRGETKFSITGVDWPTRDGSGLRDYIHVFDLATAHVRAVEEFERIMRNREEMTASIPSEVINLGTGTGVTVKEFVGAFERVLGQSIGATLAPPRPGDNAGCCTRIDKAKTLLKWSPQKTLEQGISDALAWNRHWKK